MIDTELSPRPTSPAQRTLGWVGLWIGLASFFPILVLWAHSFNPQYPLRLPHPGTILFWGIVGSDVFLASWLISVQWQIDRKSIKRRVLSKLAPAKSRQLNVERGGLLLGIVVLMLVGNHTSLVSWLGVLCSTAALVLLVLFMGHCTNLTLPTPVEELEVNGFLSPPVMPLLPLGICPPKNKFRAKITAAEVTYRRPLSARIGAGVGGLFFASLCGMCFYFTLVGSGLVSASGTRGSLFFALLMSGGFLLFLSAFVSILATAGPRELRVSPIDRTYIYRVCYPVRWKVLTGWAGKNGEDELGIPWQVLEYRGDVTDIAGIQRLESIFKSNTLYTVFLCWQDSSRSPMRVGFSNDEAKARALQAQTAGDLGVPLLADKVI